MRISARFASVCLLVLLTFGCKPKTVVVEPVQAPPEYDRPLPAGKLALHKLTDAGDIPDFTAACEHPGALRSSIDNSLNYLGKASSRQFFPYGDITHEHAVASLGAFAALLEARLPPSQMNQMIRQQFDVYISVGWDGKGTVLFTGYYTPVFDASPVRTVKYRYPLYRPPANLVKTPDGTTLGVREADGRITPLPDRRALETTGRLDGNELVWLADPFEAYIAHVQGSARLRLPDGQVITVGYAASNGHDYRSVGRELVKDGKIPADQLSLQAMIRYFKAHPDQVNPCTWRNPRFIFFTDSGGVPRGCLNEPVTPLCTIATDKSIFPRGCLAFIRTELPGRTQEGIQDRPYQGFALDQDAGGAIRAPGRCDVYLGMGDAAGELAGRTQREGRLYYLFLKPVLLTPPALQPATQPGAVVAPRQP
jgi:membrane-bound lytic murein transglycosylase A